jgi:DNA-binding HxlR family transcriptional regulator
MKRVMSKAAYVNWKPSELVTVLAVISGKWKLKIICLPFGATTRFGELLRSLAGVHGGTLTYQLRGLQADGIIQRTQ